MIRWRVTKAVVMMVGLMGGASCASHQGAVRGHQMGAEEHRAEAAQLSARANAETREEHAPPPNLSQNPSGHPEAYFSPVNPAPATQSGARAERLNRHAQQHMAIAAGLEVLEADACRGIPAAERRACPLLGPVAAIDDIPGGVRVRFAANAHVDAIAAEMRCHLAYARARGFDQAVSCPLYVRGVALSRDGGSGTIDLVSTDAKIAREIRLRSREEAVVVRDGGN